MTKDPKNILFALALLAGVQLQTQLFAQGTSFTYQGRLNNAGSPANGNYDFTFALFATNSGGTALAGPVTNTATVVSNGLFTTLVDLGAAFTGSSNWLEIAVRTNGSGAFTTLSPRNQVTPTPYAISSESVSGGISATQLTSGTIPNSVLGGFQAPFYSAVNGGIGNVNYGQYDTIAGGESNNVQSAYGFVGGGYGNSAGSSGYYATVAGGEENNAVGQAAIVGGGESNSASGQFASVTGGNSNNAYGFYSVIGGGLRNIIYGDAENYGVCTIAGGGDNLILSNAAGSFIGGGSFNQIAGDGSDYGNSVLNGGAFNAISAQNPYSVIGGGYQNKIGGTNGDAQNAVIEGGWYNTISDYSRYSIIGGGNNNEIYNNSPGSVIGGGAYNSVGYNTSYATLGGGYGNQVGGEYATVPGGVDNLAFGYASFAAGAGAQTLQEGTFVWSDAEGGLFSATGPDQFLIRAGGGVGVGTAAPQASVDIVSSNGIADPQLRLFQQNSNDYARLRFVTGTQPGWDVAMGGPTDQMNWFVGGYGNVMTLQTNGALTANSLTAGTIISGGLATSGITINNDAAIHVSGAGENTKTAAFVQTATAANTSGYYTIINNPLCNGNPNAILLITHAFNATGGVNNHAVGVGYGADIGVENQWVVYNEDLSNMNIGATFNVLVILP